MGFFATDRSRTYRDRSWCQAWWQDLDSPVPEQAGQQRIDLAVGPAHAAVVLFTGRILDGAEAERIGLVSKAVAHDQVLPTALAIAERLAAGPVDATRLTKRALNHWLRQALPNFEASLAYEMLNFLGPDAAEGLTALHADARETALTERHGLHAVGNVLALTDNEDLNVRICQSWVEIVGEMYKIHFPNKPMDTGRAVKRHVLHERLERAGAYFVASAGWEIPDWYAPAGEPARVEDFGWGATAHVVAVVAAAMVVADQPAVGFGLELADRGEPSPVERRSPAFL